MIITVRGKPVECEVEVEEGGYKILDIYDEVGESLLYDYGLSQAEVYDVYHQAERGWTDEQCAAADAWRDRIRDEGP